MKIYVGIDIGSVALKLAAIDNDGNILYSRYQRLHGQPSDVLIESISKLRASLKTDLIQAVVSTGSGCSLSKSLIGGDFINEVIALTKASSRFLPQINTLIEMGGTDSKLLCFNNNNGKIALADFAMNSLCAAGTGSFLDQQAGRLKISIENEFGELALKSKYPPRIAGRCSVFAKSDMIHLQQIATPDYDIVAGLCYAVARNFKSAIARGKQVAKPFAFAGGVASNSGMVRAFEDIFNLNKGELIIPKEHRMFCALGAALTARELKSASPFKLDSIANNRISNDNLIKRKERLSFAFPENKNYKTTLTLKRGPESVKVIDAYLGVDVGSLSTNLVVVDKNREVISRRYLMTEGRPIEAVRRGLAEIGEEVGNRVKIIGCGTTGSGRYLIGDFIGADIVRNEITAQATAAIQIDKNVDTIIEIGGQDSKYISIDNGVVVDFEMNKACAAGTGSFLQEQAEKLDIQIDQEFGERALKAGCPVGCGERCTVFMETDLNAYQQVGIDKDDLVAGLAYSIAINYLTRVVEKRRIGDNIFFQGGVAWNKGVVAAFEKILGKSITVPPHHDVTGAIGAALLAQENDADQKTNFKGFDLSSRKYTVESFICEDCSNSCEIRKVEIEGENPLYYGSRCEKYDTETKDFTDSSFDFYRFREKKLYSSITPIGKPKRNLTIGFPRILIFHELYPFWASFFRKLGYRVILSAPTNQKILSHSLENFSAETCFPIKLATGHVQSLLDKNVDYIFLPSIINIREDHDPHENSFLCPYIQSIPYTIQANIDFNEYSSQLITVPISLKMEKEYLYQALSELRIEFGWGDHEYRQAIKSGLEMQDEFYRALLEKGREFIANRDKSKPAVCIISRPYNGCDARLSLEIPKKLSRLGVDVISMEALPVSEKYGDLANANMYWRFGQKILAAAELIRGIPNLYPVYISNFGCGPDSFITHFFEKRLNGKPYLQIEIDEHSADAGIVTRLEAFLDSLKAQKRTPENSLIPTPSIYSQNGRPRKIYIPYMNDNALAVAAAFRSCGIDSEALPKSNNHSLEFGKKHTSGKECFPCAVTTGDILAKINSPEFDRANSAFFMPSASGPCRFGQYHMYQRQVLDELGYSDIPLISPNSRSGYDDDILGSGDFQKVAWRGLVAADLLYKVYHRFRPYQSDKTEIDKLYDRYLIKLSNHIENRKELEPLFISALADFKAFKTEVDNLPVIGVVGEIFLRGNCFSNNYLVDQLERLGARIWMPPMAEWVFYTNYTYRLRVKEENRMDERIKAGLTNLIQHREENRLVTILQDDIPEAYDPPVEYLIKLARPYLDVSFSGEAILSIGKAIEYYHNGAGGVINTIPFNCMPGTVVAALSGKLSHDLEGLPWLNLAYEGLSDKGNELKLEAFVHQARQFSRQKAVV